MILTDYEATLGNASTIFVDDVRAVQITDGSGTDVTRRLFDAGILRGAGFIGSVGYALALDVAGAIRSLFPVEPEVVATPVFYAESDETKLFVSPTFQRLRREARIGTRFERGVKIVYYRKLESDYVSDELERIEAAAETLANGRAERGVEWFVTEVEVETLDEEQLTQELIYCASIELTFTAFKGA